MNPLLKTGKRMSNGHAGFSLKATLSIAALSLLLTACGGEEGDDLDQFMREAGKDMKGKVEPLPEIKPYDPAIYNADNSLNDPFLPRKATIKAKGGLQPNLDRPREALEAFPLQSLQLVGVLKRGKEKVALIRTPENNVQQIRVGNYLGQNLGMAVSISDVTPVEVKIKEIVQDELTGDWMERPASIVQQEQ
jgi:type IV pilus assembly protein PilP